MTRHKPGMPCDRRSKVTIADNGMGISKENLTRIFSHGFTTRKDGRGFGLHSGALAAKEMGGSLTTCSGGPGCGATFTLDLPPANVEVLTDSLTDADLASA